MALQAHLGVVCALSCRMRQLTTSQRGGQTLPRFAVCDGAFAKEPGQGGPT